MSAQFLDQFGRYVARVTGGNIVSVFFSFRIPGMMVLTSALDKMKRNAISGIVISAGIIGRKASARSTLAVRSLGTK